MFYFKRIRNNKKIIYFDKVNLILGFYCGIWFEVDINRCN